MLNAFAEIWQQWKINIFRCIIFNEFNIFYVWLRDRATSNDYLTQNNIWQPFLSPRLYIPICIDVVAFLFIYIYALCACIPHAYINSCHNFGRKPTRWPTSKFYDNQISFFAQQSISKIILLSFLYLKHPEINLTISDTKLLFQ